MNEYAFAERLAWSKGKRADDDAETIHKLIPGCAEVAVAPTVLDRLGIDYVATLRRGATLNIDTKTREVGVSRHWKSYELFGVLIEPELTIECYSIVPVHRGFQHPDTNSGDWCPEGAPGWTIDESKLTDYVLYLFDPSDTEECFLLPFQLLRMATIANWETWRGKFMRPHCRSEKNGRRWETESCYPPAWCVIDAVAAEMRTLKPSGITL